MPPQAKPSAGHAHKRWLLLAPIAVLALLWGGGFGFFLLHIPLSTPSHPARTDALERAIVVLTGGERRVAEGLSLLTAGQGDRLLISGVSEKISSRDLWAHTGGVGPGNSAHIELDAKPNNTAENARETAIWVRRHGYRSLLIVTSAYHLPRSALLFARALPEVDLLLHPVYAREFPGQKWWRQRRSWELLMSEYHKYMITLLMPTLVSTDPSATSKSDEKSARSARIAK